MTANTQSASTNTNRLCPICKKSFDIMEYAFHIQEEQLANLQRIEHLLTDIKDITEYTYELMKDVPDDAPINSNENIPVGADYTDEDRLLDEEIAKAQAQRATEEYNSIYPLESNKPPAELARIEQSVEVKEAIKQQLIEAKDDPLFNEIINKIMR